MIRLRVDDYPGTKPEEFCRHNLENFKRFHEVVAGFVPWYVLGVIPRHVSDDDLRWLGAQREVVVALHGIDHDERFPNEFRDHMTELDRRHAIQRARGRFQLLTGQPVVDYIPPHNVIDRKTVDALYHTGFKTLHIGPGSEGDASLYAQMERHLHVAPSFPPHFYGRTDEMLARCSPAVIRKDVELRSRPFSSMGPDTWVTLHWTWEHNVGLETLSEFLAQLADLF